MSDYLFFEDELKESKPPVLIGEFPAHLKSIDSRDFEEEVKDGNVIKHKRTAFNLSFVIDESGKDYKGSDPQNENNKHSGEMMVGRSFKFSTWLNHGDMSKNGWYYQTAKALGFEFETKEVDGKTASVLSNLDESIIGNPVMLKIGKDKRNPANTFLIVQRVESWPEGEKKEFQFEVNDGHEVLVEKVDF